MDAGETFIPYLTLRSLKATSQRIRRRLSVCALRVRSDFLRFIPFIINLRIEPIGLHAMSLLKIIIRTLTISVKFHGAFLYEVEYDDFIRYIQTYLMLT